MSEHILIIADHNISRGTLVAMLMEAAAAIAIPERPAAPPQADRTSEVMQALASFEFTKECEPYYDYRDYYAEALQGIAEKRAWLAQRVSLILKTIRSRFTRVHQRKLCCWSSRRWKSLT